MGGPRPRTRPSPTKAPVPRRSGQERGCANVRRREGRRGCRDSHALHFRTLTGPKAYLDHLVVASDSRRRGVARALLEYAIEQARAGGASRIDLTANTEKQAGRALYGHSASKSVTRRAS